jgi:hypothetical protein
MKEKGVRLTRWRECLMDFARFMGLLGLGAGFFLGIAVSEVVPIWLGFAGLIPAAIGLRYRSRFQTSLLALLSSTARGDARKPIQLPETTRGK